MEKHTVDIDEAVEIGKWFKSWTMAAAHGAEENKRLYIESVILKNHMVESRFVVESHKERRYVGKYLDVAVRTYNEA
jgi:hypothetical protein